MADTTDHELRALRKRVDDLEKELIVRRATGKATEGLLTQLQPLVLAAQLDGGIHALRAAATDYTPAHGTWQDFLTGRADSLQRRRDALPT